MNLECNLLRPGWVMLFFSPELRGRREAAGQLVCTSRLMLARSPLHLYAGLQGQVAVDSVDGQLIRYGVEHQDTLTFEAAEQFGASV
jgi:hypothetical protein